MTDHSDSYAEAVEHALKQAKDRRTQEESAERPKELGGREGPEPVRYGDWERKGLAVDF